MRREPGFQPGGFWRKVVVRHDNEQRVGGWHGNPLMMWCRVLEQSREMQLIHHGQSRFRGSMVATVCRSRCALTGFSKLIIRPIPAATTGFVVVGHHSLKPGEHLGFLR